MARLSVIIPTRDRQEPLRQCLATLQAQDAQASELEVVVVDDGSTGELAPLVNGVASQGSISMRCVRQSPSGLNAARNRGLEATNGDLLAFLDDDTLVSPGWAAALLHAFDEHGCDAIAGRVELGIEGPEPDWLDVKRGYLAELELGPEPRWLDPDTLPVGANCAVRRSAMERVGGFLPGLDRVGTSLVSNGDTEFFLRLRDAGGRFRYEPKAHVVHCIPDQRLTLDYALKRAFAQGVSDELLRQLRRPSPGWRRRVRVVWRYGRTAPIFVKGILVRRGAANARLWISYCRGLYTAVDSPTMAYPSHSS